MASASEKVFVAGLGVQTPIGHCYQSAGAAVRCGISAHGEHPFMIDQYGEPIIVAMDREMEDSNSALDRVTQLATGAITEALAPVSAASGLNLPELDSLLAVGEHLQHEKFAGVGKQLFPSHQNLRLSVVDEGHAGAILGLQYACHQISQGAVDFFLVVGADSYLQPDVLESLDLEGRLHSVNYSWGFTPGEGAGAILLASQSAIREYSLDILAELVSVETTEEEVLLGSESVCIGQGLSNAFFGALNTSAPISDIYCDLNGETYRAEEYGFSICRTDQFFDDASRFTAPAEYWGDVGAASPVLGIALAIAAWKGEYADGDNALVWSSSADRPLRGATVIRRAHRGRI